MGWGLCKLYGWKLLPRFVSARTEITEMKFESKIKTIMI